MLGSIGNSSLSPGISSVRVDEIGSYIREMITLADSRKRAQIDLESQLINCREEEIQPIIRVSIQTKVRFFLRFFQRLSQHFLKMSSLSGNHLF